MDTSNSPPLSERGTPSEPLPPSSDDTRGTPSAHLPPLSEDLRMGINNYYFYLVKKVELLLLMTQLQALEFDRC